MFCSQCGKESYGEYAVLPVLRKAHRHSRSGTGEGRELGCARQGSRRGAGRRSRCARGRRRRDDADSRRTRRGRLKKLLRAPSGRARAEAPVRSGEGAKDGAELLRRGGESAAHTGSGDGANPILDMSLQAEKAAAHSGRLAREAAEASPRSEGAIRAGAGGLWAKPRGSAERCGDSRRFAGEGGKVRSRWRRGAPRRVMPLRGAARRRVCRSTGRKKGRLPGACDLDDVDPEPVHARAGELRGRS